jgi:AcrR family transcriptional regulator
MAAAGRRRPLTRERMIEAAESLMRERGLSGAGIKQVTALSRAPIGSVYHHFPQGKTQIVSEALRIHGEKARRLLEASFATREPLPQRLRTFFRKAADGFDRTGGRKGCAIGAVTLDLGVNDAALRGVCREVFDSWIATIAPQLPWPSDERRLSFAEMIVTALEGAFILGRARESGEPFRIAGEWLAAAAEASLPH